MVIPLPLLIKIIYKYICKYTYIYINQPPNPLNWLLSTVLTPHSALVDIIEHFHIFLLMEQTHIPEKQQELGVHSRHCQCNGNHPSGQTSWPEAIPRISPAALAGSRSPSASPGQRGEPTAGGWPSKPAGLQASPRMAVHVGSRRAVESAVCEHACSHNTPEKSCF